MTKKEFDAKLKLLQEKMNPEKITMEQYEAISREIHSLIDDFVGQEKNSKLDQGNHEAWLIAG